MGCREEEKTYSDGPVYCAGVQGMARGNLGPRHLAYQRQVRLVECLFGLNGDRLGLLGGVLAHVRNVV